MEKSLPPRPHLDHLRRQAKELLAALAAGDTVAIQTIQQYLPSAEGMKPHQLRKVALRLADAQSAVARQSGFASWPQLARHVEQLRALEGTWAFETLEVEGQTMPASILASSRILMDGDRFRTESPEANYEGIFNINVEAEPHEIDIEFVEGPEAGNWNYGIFQLEGDELRICLDMSGKSRPKAFAAPKGSGHACESLRRASKETPQNVTGRQRSVAPPTPVAEPCVGFEYVKSLTLTKLQGEWNAIKLVLDGKELPKMMLTTGSRKATMNDLTISFGGKVMIHALVRLNDAATPIEVDYYRLDSAARGSIQQGIMQWQGDTACFIMGGPGQPRPSDFECPPGSGRTLSHWKPRV